VKRWAKNIFAALCLLIFASTLTIWVISYWGGGYVVRTIEKLDPAEPKFAVQEMQYVAECGGGDVWFQRFRRDFRYEALGLAGWGYGRGNPLWGVDSSAPPTRETTFRFAGIYYGHRVRQWGINGMSTVCLVLPLWLFLPAAIPPFIWWRRWRKKDRSGFPVTMAESANQELNDQADRTTKTATSD